MFKLIISLSVLLAVANCMPQRPAPPPAEQRAIISNIPDRPPTPEEIAQNQNAKYEYSSNIEDHISDLSQQRLEVRDGVNVKGMYSYSDGYFRRTIQYEADDQGYRVTGESVEPLQGPQVDLNGSASVDTAAHGTQVKYTVQSIPDDKPQVV